MSNNSEIHNLIKKSRERDGYIRESAVYELAHYHNDSVLPILLERLNDYVEQVRHAARMSLHRWLNLEHLPILLNYAHYFLHSENQSRTDHQWLLLRLVQLIESNFLNSKIPQFLQQKQGKAVRALFILAQRQEWFDSEELLELTLHSADPVVRGYALQYFVQSTHEEQCALLPRFDTTVNHQLRYGVLLYAIQHLPRDVLEQSLIQALVSPAQSLMTLSYHIFYQKGWTIKQLVDSIIVQSSSSEKASLQLLKLMQWRHQPKEWEFIKQHYPKILDINPIPTLKTRLIFNEVIDIDEVISILINNAAHISDINSITRHLSGLNADTLDYILSKLLISLQQKMTISEFLPTWEYMQFVLHKMKQHPEEPFESFQLQWKLIIKRLSRADLYPVSLSIPRRRSIQQGIDLFRNNLQPYFIQKTSDKAYSEQLRRFGLYLWLNTDCTYT